MKFCNIYIFFFVFYPIYYLKDSEQSIDNRIEVWGWSSFWEVELSSKELHPEEGEDEDEEEEEKEKGHDGGERVHQGDHQIT